VRAAAVASAAGLVGGALLGYFRFGHSPGYGVVLGIGFAAILGMSTWRTVRDPERVAQLSERGPATVRLAVIRVVLPFLALGVATVVGIVAESGVVFVVLLAVGLAVVLLGSRLLSR
jgi:hypothetical protein